VKQALSRYKLHVGNSGLWDFLNLQSPYFLYFRKPEELERMKTNEKR
jgi:hypothetical protein